MRAHASVQPTNASPIEVTGARTVCHGRRRSNPSASAVKSASRIATSVAWAAPSTRADISVDAAKVPAAPPIWTGVRTWATASAASQTPLSHAAALTPKVVGIAG
jgi:hypothetical protein